MQNCNYVTDLTDDVIEHIEKHGNEITKQTLAGLLDIKSVQSQLPSALSAATLDASIAAMRLYKI